MPLSFWRDLSLILLILYGIIAAILPLVALYFANRGMRWLRVRAGIYLPLAKSYVWRGRDVTVNACSRLTAPLIETQARLVGVETVVDRIRRKQ